MPMHVTVSVNQGGSLYQAAKYLGVMVGISTISCDGTLFLSVNSTPSWKGVQIADDLMSCLRQALFAFNRP